MMHETHACRNCLRSSRRRSADVAVPVSGQLRIAPRGGVNHLYSVEKPPSGRLRISVYAGPGYCFTPGAQHGTARHTIRPVRSSSIIRLSVRVYPVLGVFLVGPHSAPHSAALLELPFLDRRVTSARPRTGTGCGWEEGPGGAPPLQRERCLAIEARRRCCGGHTARAAGARVLASCGRAPFSGDMDGRRSCV